MRNARRYHVHDFFSVVTGGFAKDQAHCEARKCLLQLRERRPSCSADSSGVEFSNNHLEVVMQLTEKLISYVAHKSRWYNRIPGL